MNATPIEFEVTSKVPVDRLRLDRLNPRLIGQANNASDESIIARLYRSAEIDELLQSMSANGYLDIEPLIVMQDPNSDCLIVLEGNRRLAALRLLREADPINRMWTSKEIRIRVPPVDELLRSTFHHVSVYAVDSRQRARSFIGFKHINGPAKWDAYAKAKFAADWYRSERPHVSLEAIAGSIGDRHDTIKRMVSAIYVLEQAEREELFDTHDRNTRKFTTSPTSTLRYRALNTWTISASGERGRDTIPHLTRSLLNVSTSFEKCSFGSTDRSRRMNCPSYDLRTPISRISARCLHTPKLAICSKQHTISIKHTRPLRGSTRSLPDRCFVREMPLETPRHRYAHMTDGINRCLMSPRISRCNQIVCMPAWREHIAERMFPNDASSLSSNRIRGCPVGRAIPIALGHRRLMRFHAAGIEGAVSYAWPSEGAGGAAWAGHAGRWRADAGVRYVLPIRRRRVDDSA